MKTRHIIAVITLIMAFIVSSCQYEFIEIDLPPIDPDVPISFSEEIVPIFNNKCLSCHGGNIAPDLSAGAAYNSIVPSLVNLDVPEDSKIYTHPAPTSSHAARYSDAEAFLILTWIEQGAQNN